MRFTVGEHSPHHVRRIVRSYLQLWDLSDLVDAAELAVTELLANVVRHVPDRRCSVLVLRRPGGVRVEVWDGSPEKPYVRASGALDECGRGLALVAAVVDGWGVEPAHEGGKTVWFECGRTPGATPDGTHGSTSGNPPGSTSNAPPGSAPTSA
nr:ATP-binding protein [Streptomyces pathocidini]